MGGLCCSTLGCVYAVINITPCTDTRCSQGRLERILHYTKTEFLGNFQGVLRAGASGAQILADPYEAVFITQANIPSWLQYHKLHLLQSKPHYFFCQLLQFQLGKSQIPVRGL